MAENYRYPIRYKLDFGAFTKEDLAVAEAGGADKVAIISVMGLSGEASSTCFPSIDGETGKPWSDELWFKEWVALAHELMDSKTLSDAKKSICAGVFGIVRDAILESRGVDERTKN